jgi:hypothetical protein
LARNAVTKNKRKIISGIPRRKQKAALTVIKKLKERENDRQTMKAEDSLDISSMTSAQQVYYLYFIVY